MKYFYSTVLLSVLFAVTSFGNFVPPNTCDICEPCVSQVSWLTLKYSGYSGTVSVIARKGKRQFEVFSDYVSSGSTFSFKGYSTNNGYVLGPEINIYYNGGKTSIHTSCSQSLHVNEEDYFGGVFTVLDGCSRSGPGLNVNGDLDGKSVCGPLTCQNGWDGHCPTGYSEKSSLPTSECGQTIEECADVCCKPNTCANFWSGNCDGIEQPISPLPTDICGDNEHTCRGHCCQPATCQNGWDGHCPDGYVEKEHLPTGDCGDTDAQCDHTCCEPITCDSSAWSQTCDSGYFLTASTQTCQNEHDCKSKCCEAKTCTNFWNQHCPDTKQALHPLPGGSCGDDQSACAYSCCEDKTCNNYWDEVCPTGYLEKAHRPSGNCGSNDYECDQYCCEPWSCSRGWDGDCTNTNPNSHPKHPMPTGDCGLTDAACDHFCCELDTCENGWDRTCPSTDIEKHPFPSGACGPDCDDTCCEPKTCSNYWSRSCPSGGYIAIDPMPEGNCGTTQSQCEHFCCEPNTCQRGWDETCPHGQHPKEHLPTAPCFDHCDDDCCHPNTCSDGWDQTCPTGYQRDYHATGACYDDCDNYCCKPITCRDGWDGVCPEGSHEIAHLPTGICGDNDTECDNYCCEADTCSNGWDGHCAESGTHPRHPLPSGPCGITDAEQDAFCCEPDTCTDNWDNECNTPGTQFKYPMPSGPCGNSDAECDDFCCEPFTCSRGWNGHCPSDQHPKTPLPTGECCPLQGDCDSECGAFCCEPNKCDDGWDGNCNGDQEVFTFPQPVAPCGTQAQCDSECCSPCGCCEDKIKVLAFKWEGSDGVHLTIQNKQGGQFLDVDTDDDLSNVQNGDIITVYGTSTNKKGASLGPWVYLSSNEGHDINIHTSCSVSIGPGVDYGDLVIVYAEDALGNVMCDIEYQESNCGSGSRQSGTTVNPSYVAGAGVGLVFFAGLGVFMRRRRLRRAKVGISGQEDVDEEAEMEPRNEDQIASDEFEN